MPTGVSSLGQYAFTFDTIELYQQKSEILKRLPMECPNQFIITQLGTANIICKTEGKDFKIVVSDEMLPHLVRWYHLVTAHAEGMS